MSELKNSQRINYKATYVQAKLSDDYTPHAEGGRLLFSKDVAPAEPSKNPPSSKHCESQAMNCEHSGMQLPLGAPRHERELTPSMPWVA